MTARLIAGCGYVGMQVAAKWLQAGDKVFAFTRDGTRSDELGKLGIRPILWNWLSGSPPREQDSWSEFRKCMVTSETATLLVAVSHAPQPDIDPRETHTRGLVSLKHALLAVDSRNTMDWIYLSTTGVFGDTAPGEWVDEKSKVGPNRPGSIAAWEAEQWLADNLESNRQLILRPAGIYGPNRVPRWQSIRDQMPLRADPDSYLNLIHVADLASIVECFSNQKTLERLYCVSDGQPVLRREYYEFISQLGNWPPPLFESLEWNSTSNRTSRSDGNKRISNNRIQRDLSYPFLFPSYREGLRSLLKELGKT
ncbi:MAG: NAD-dependent epimerase/dehydratase family protein [Pirellula staleyi]